MIDELLARYLSTYYLINVVQNFTTFNLKWENLGKSFTTACCTKL